LQQDEALSNFELDEMLKNSRSYLGTFSHDRIPDLKNKNFSAIINYHTYEQPGSHWICIYNDPKKTYVEFYDSYGLPPSNMIIDKLKQTGKKVLYSTSKIQNITSSRCGYYCYYYIIMRDRGMNPYDIIYQFNPNSKNNDNILIDLLEDKLNS